MTTELFLSKAQKEPRINNPFDAYPSIDQCMEAEGRAEQTYIELSKIMDGIRSKTESFPPQDLLRRQCERYRKQQLDLEPFISPLTLAKLNKLIGEFQELLKSDKESSERAAFWSSSQMSMSSSTSSIDKCESTVDERTRALLRAEILLSSVETASFPSSSSHMSSSASTSSSISSGSTCFSRISSSSTSAAQIASSMLESETEIRGVEKLITIPNSADLNKVVASLTSEIPVTIGDTELIVSVGERVLFHYVMIPYFANNEESDWVTSLRACKRVRVEVLLYALENALKAKNQTLIKNCLDRIQIISRELDKGHHYEKEQFAQLKMFSLNVKEGIASHLKYIAEVRRAMYKQWGLH